MIEEADRYKEQDEQIKAAIAARNDLEMYVYQVKSMVSGKSGKLPLCSVPRVAFNLHKAACATVELQSDAVKFQF